MDEAATLGVDLASAYLAEHDETPIDKAWLHGNEIGFNTISENGGESRIWNILLEHPARPNMRIAIPADGLTRGDVRKLQSAITHK